MPSSYWFHGAERWADASPTAATATNTSEPRPTTLVEPPSDRIRFESLMSRSSVASAHVGLAAFAASRGPLKSRRRIPMRAIESASITPVVPDLTIVIPVYNEGEAVEPVLRALSAAVVTSHEILVVYDFDGDSTVPAVRRLEREVPGLSGLRNDLGRGVLNAMRVGIAAARGEFVLISMADGSDEPHIVDAMVELARTGAGGVDGRSAGRCSSDS
jgi:hypothetical protein